MARRACNSDPAEEDRGLELVGCFVRQGRRGKYLVTGTSQIEGEYGEETVGGGRDRGRTFTIESDSADTEAELVVHPGLAVIPGVRQEPGEGKLCV